MVTTLLSNLGIVGFVLFGLFIYGLLRPVPARFNRNETEILRRSVSPFQAALFGLILMHAISNPNLSTLALWVQIGGVLGLKASLRNFGMAPVGATRPRRRSATARLGYSNRSGAQPAKFG
jgi:hypothetical protein